MLPVVVLPQSQKIVLEYLRAALADRDEDYAADVKVGRTVTLSSLPFVQVRGAGGGQETPGHDRPRFDFIVWHEDPTSRERLCALVRSLVRAADWDETPTGRLKWWSEFMAPTEMPDPEDVTSLVHMTTHEFTTS